MFVTKSCVLMAMSAIPAGAFAPSSFSLQTKKSGGTVLRGYLDDLSSDLAKELRGEDKEEREAELERKSTDMSQEDKDRYGVGDWSSFVDFDEFDGGDGQMGVAGDGNKGLAQEWKGEAHIATSRSRSAKNAWGSSTGYAQEKIDSGMEATRAQQMENWQNQQQLKSVRDQHKYMSETFDQEEAPDDNWRTLSKFGVERNEEFDLDESFGAVTPEKVYHHIELSTSVNRAEVFEFNLLNSFMGYSDFRARFTAETPADWSVEPKEGSLNGKKGTDFTVKFRPSNPSVATGFLVIQTEDDKWTFQVTGTGSM